MELEAIGALDRGGDIEKELLKANLETNLKAKTEDYGDNLIVDYAGYKFLIEQDGNVMFWDGEATVANAPKLTKGMIPVKYNVTSQKWQICLQNDEEWYSYTQEDKKWANVMLCDGKYNESTAVGTEVAEEDLGSMFVWIPRFSYKITKGYHQNSGELNVQWVSGKSYSYVNETGELKKARNGNDDGVITSSGYTDYVVHPAFTDGSSNQYSNGEWRQEITGLWVAKFQAGIHTTDNDTSKRVAEVNNFYYPIFKGRKYGYNYVTVSEAYKLSLGLSNKENPYGLTANSNSHLMKNSEWGAAAYLSISQYGYSNGSSNNEKYKNNLSIVSGSNMTASPVTNPNNSSWKITGITGYSATSGKAAENVMTYTSTTDFTDSVTGTNGTSYAWNNVENGKDTGHGTKSSTTGNIYGIYDMGGCLSDYISTYVNAEGVTYLTTYGGAFANGQSTYLATAYPYNPTTADYKDFNSAYPGFSKIFGDAIYEVSSDVGETNAWFGQALENDAGIGEVFFPRGGVWYTRCKSCRASAACMTLMGVLVMILAFVACS